MINKESPNPAISGEMLRSKKMTFAITGMAFRTISTSLYSDKITAIIRELACNAFDAMVASDQPDKPFTVSLPTILSPTFKVSDTGTGMSEATVFGLYSTVFDSSKTETNTQVGMFGLGKLAPMCYADSFILTSIHDNTKTTYIIAYDDDGIPNVNAISSESTQQKNGVTVELAVKSKDFSEFHAKAEDVFRDFKVRPNINGLPLVIRDIYNPDVQGDGWKARSRHSSHYGSRAIQGNIGYPIKIINCKDITPLQQIILNSYIDIEFKTGELNVTPSRESLSLDNRTIANIQKRLNEIAEEITQRIVKKMESAENLWAARLVRCSFKTGVWTRYHDILAMLNYSWKGNPVSMADIDFQHDGVTGWKYSTSFAPRSGSKREPLPTLFPISQKIEFIECDMKIGAGRRVKAVIDFKEKDTIYLMQFANADAKSAFISAMGMEGMSLRKASELPKVEIDRTCYAASAQAKARVLRLRSAEMNFHKSGKENFIVENVDFAKGGVYILIDRFKLSSGEMNNNWFFDLRTLNFNIDSQQPIYAFKESMRAKVQANPNWITVRSFCQKKIKELLAVRDYSQDLARLRSHDKLDKNITSFFIEYRKTFSTRLTSVANDIKAEIEFKTLNYKILSYPIIAQRYGCALLPDAPIDKVIQTKVEEVLNAYPMLKLLISTASYNGGKIADDYKLIIQDYLMQIEAKNHSMQIENKIQNKP